MPEPPPEIRPDPATPPASRADAPLRVIRLDEVDSTNLFARRLVEGGARTGPTLIVAGTQTSGRGRLGRAWASPPGGLWCTLVERLAPGAPADPGDLGVRLGEACLACVNGVLDRAASAGGRRPVARLKAPNDVLLETDAGPRKVLGILTEVVAFGGRRFVLVGVGVNAQVDVSALAPELRGIACSLSEVAGVEIGPERVLEALIGPLRAALAPLTGGPAFDGRGGA